MRERLLVICQILLVDKYLWGGGEGEGESDEFGQREKSIFPALCPGMGRRG